MRTLLNLENLRNNFVDNILEMMTDDKPQVSEKALLEEI